MDEIQLAGDKFFLLLVNNGHMVSHSIMTALSDFQTIQLIIRHCMKVEGIFDEEVALQTAKKKDFIVHGQATRAGRIVAALVQADEDVTEFKIRQISDRLDVPDQQPNHRLQ